MTMTEVIIILMLLLYYLLAFLINGKTRIMVSVLIKQISVVDELEQQRSREKRPFELTNSAHTLVECCALITVNHQPHLKYK